MSLSPALSDHNDSHCFRCAGGRAHLAESLREEFAAIAIEVANRQRRGRLALQAQRLASDYRIRRATPDPVVELQFERAWKLLFRAFLCEEHFAEDKEEVAKQPRNAVPRIPGVPDRLRGAALAARTADAAHAATHRKDVIVTLGWAVQDVGRYLTKAAGFDEKTGRSLARLRSADGAALFTPTQVAAAAHLITGVCRGEVAAARVTVGATDDASAVGYLRRVAVAVYRSGISGGSSPLVELTDAQLLADLSVLRRREQWEHGEDKAIAFYEEWTGRAHEMLTTSVEARAERVGDVTADATPMFGVRPMSDREAELVALLELREEAHLLPGGDPLTPAQRALLDRRIAELTALLS